MAILPIATVGHPELKIVAKEVTREELASAEVQQFIDDLVETMRHANGRKQPSLPIQAARTPHHHGQPGHHIPR